MTSWMRAGVSDGPHVGLPIVQPASIAIFAGHAIAAYGRFPYLCVSLNAYAQTDRREEMCSLAGAWGFKGKMDAYKVVGTVITTGVVNPLWMYSS